MKQRALWPAVVLLAVVGVTVLPGQYSDNIATFTAGVLIAALPVLLISVLSATTRRRHRRMFHEGLT